MNFKKQILLTLIHILLILAVSPHVQSQEIKNADDILEQLENGEDVNYENIQIIGIFNIDKIDLPKGYGDRLISLSASTYKNSIISYDSVSVNYMLMRYCRKNDQNWIS